MAKGTSGVVIDDVPRGWLFPTVRVRFDTGYGTREANARVGSLRVTRRGSGIERFERRAGTLRAVRVGVAVALLLPMLWFVTEYLWINRTLDGMVGAMLIAAVDSAVSTVEYALTNPVQALALLTVMWAAGRFAFGR